MIRPQFKAQITALSHDGRGIARLNGKTTFIEGALPGETVQFTYRKKHGSFDEGVAVSVQNASLDRAVPACSYYGVCGGCQLQHLSVEAQQQLKQTAFLEQLQSFGGVKPEILLPTVTGPSWGYRRRARLSVKYVGKKQAVLVGFREQNARYLADIHGCEILSPPFNDLIQPLRILCDHLSAKQHIPQIELAGGDNQAALIIRHQVALSRDDLEQLIGFAHKHSVALYLQPGGMESIHRLWPDEVDLSYNLENARSDDTRELELQFDPWDFIQVNAWVNRKMVSQALNLLALKSHDHVLELFCGLGNFSLAMAQQCQKVTGIEGNKALVERARSNAEHNQLQNVDFYVANLLKSLTEHQWSASNYTALLIDPPRSGAIEIMPYLTQWQPKRIGYISCNPATLARDARLLSERGYRLQQAGLLDMFPHTRHSEWICLFVRKVTP